MFIRNKNNQILVSATESFRHRHFKRPPTAGKHLCLFLFKVAHLLAWAPPPSRSRLHYPGGTAPLSAAPVRLADSQNQSVWPCFFSPAFPLCVLLLLLPGVNLRRREKKTYPSFCSVRGPLPICFYFPPRWYHWLPRRASQLASFTSPS